MGVLWSDVRQAVRTLRRSPGFALVAVSTLALGIGATTAVFSVVNALLLRPLPYADASRLVAVWPSATSNKTMVHRVAESVTALKSVSGISIWTVTVTGDTAAPEEVEVALVSPNHFETLGATPVLGRSFTAEEGRIGTDGVIVLSDAYWRRRCGRRVAVQLLTESAVLALAGGGLGVGLAFGLLRLIVSRAPADLPDIASISVDATVLGFALGASLLSSFLFGLAPVLRARGATAADALRQGMRGGIGAPRRAVVSHLLVGAEIGLAVLLVVGAGLMVRTLGRMYAVDPGFHAGGVLAFRVSPPSFRYGDAPAIRSFYSQLRERLAAIPAIESVAGIQLLPVTNGNWSFPVFIDGNPVPEGGTAPSVNFRVTTPGYFETMRIPLLAGRTIQPGDANGALRVVVINRSMAEQLFPGEEPIGRTLRVFGTSYSIVGIAGDVHQRSLDTKPRPEMYVAHDQIDWDVSLWLVTRARNGDAMALAPFIRDAVRATDADAPVSGLTPMASVIGDSALTTRFITFLLGSFGLLALLLGAIGVYGVTAYTMARRLPEFGVRIALGASRRDVLAAATVHAILPVIGGLAAGLTAALLTSRVMESVLFEVRPHDPLTFAGAPLVLALVALVAALVPAMRASRVDPVRVMRSD